MGPGVEALGDLDCSCVLRLAEAEMRIPGPGGEHAVMILQRGTLDVALSIPGVPKRQTPHAQERFFFVVRGRGVLVPEARGICSVRATCCLWLPGSSINS